MNIQEVPKSSFLRSKKFIAVVGVIVVIWIVVISSDNSAPAPANQPPSTAQPPQEQTPTMSKDDATKEFERLMELSKLSGLVTSYEIDENTSLKIYVGKVWYTQEVQFKKDAIAKFSMLQQAIYGRHRLEVRDAYSNEKVAEVTAFSGSLEIYK